MSRIKTIAQHPSVVAASSYFHEQLQHATQLAIQIQQVPAPTFSEHARALFVEKLFSQLGLQEVHQDELNNVYGRYMGQDSSLPPVVVSAHTDTVFPAETDLTIRSAGNRIYGPGLADNSAGVAGLIMLGEALFKHNLQPKRDIWFVANIAEEGLGDLKGMRAVVQKFGQQAIYLVVEGGSFGHIVHRAIGVNRFRLNVKAAGGHSWADFGQPSAIHALGRIIAAIDALEVPQFPKTTYNVGVIEGGTSINTIAETASLLLDLRSEDNHELAKLVDQVRQIVQQFNEQASVTVDFVQIGNRPAGQLDRDAELVRWAGDALWQVGCRRIEYGASSTDANIPLSLGCQAVCIGLAYSGNVHRLDEYLDTTHLSKGLEQLLLLTLVTADF